MAQKTIVNILAQVLRNLPGAAQVNQQITNLKDIRGIVCYNQSNLANYIFLSSRKHKRLKTALINYNSNNGKDQLDELKIAYFELDDYLENDFRKVSDYHFTEMIKIFKKKSITTKTPRICIKGFIGENIITLIRNEFTTKEKEYPLDANTAFKKIMETRRHYLCENIPHQIQRRAYKNARINEYDVINEYSSDLLRNLKFWLANKPDKKWQKCWEKDDNGERPRIDSCYKTTLVVPMSFPSDKGWITQEFINHFATNSIVCFGFLCLDHQNVGYFKEEDIDIAYVFADFLSLYLFQKYTCSSYSKVWKEANSIVKPQPNNT